MSYDEKVIARFWSYVDIRSEDECWEWKRGRHRFGYGVFYPQPRPNRGRLTHQFAYEVTKGSRGALFVLHKCDNPPCCNPAHLRLGTQADNMREMNERGRHVKVVRKPGQRWHGKLVDEQVYEARRLLDDGALLKDVAKKFGISIPTASNIRLRNIWKHLPEEDPEAARLRPRGAPKGMRNGLSKMTDEQVREGRKLLDAGARQADVAALLGVSPITASRLKRRKGWTHITDA